MLSKLFNQIDEELKGMVRECDSIDSSLDIAFLYLYAKLSDDPSKDYAIMNVYDEYNDIPVFRLEVSKEVNDDNEVSYVFGIPIMDNDEYDQDNTLLFDNREDYFGALKYSLKGDYGDTFLAEIAGFKHLIAIIMTMLSDTNNLEEFSTNNIKLIKEKDGNISASLSQQFKQKLKCK